MMDVKPHTKIRLVIADDHAAVRRGIRRILNASPRIEVIGEARNGQEALDLAQALHPDLLLLDIEMPNMNGLEVARILQQNASHINFLILSAYDDISFIQGTLKAGACGYLTKDEAPNFLIPAILSISQGQIPWLSDRVKRRLNAIPD